MRKTGTDISRARGALVDRRGLSQPFPQDVWEDIFHQSWTSDWYDQYVIEVSERNLAQPFIVKLKLVSHFYITFSQLNARYFSEFIRELL